MTKEKRYNDCLKNKPCGNHMFVFPDDTKIGIVCSKCKCRVRDEEQAKRLERVNEVLGSALSK